MSYKKKKNIKKENKEHIEKHDLVYKTLVKEINNFNKKLHNLPPNTFIDMRI